MKSKMRLATLILLGAVPLAGIGADYGSSGSQSGSMGSSGTSRDQSSSGMSGSSSAGAQSDMTVPKQFRKLDKDKDGMISQSEAKRSKDVADHFSEYDTDGDGKISLSEWQTHAATGAAGVSGSTRSGAPSGGATPEVSAPSGAGKGGSSGSGMGSSSSGGMGGSSGGSQ